MPSLDLFWRAIVILGFFAGVLSAVYILFVILEPLGVPRLLLKLIAWRPGAARKRWTVEGDKSRLEESGRESPSEGDKRLREEAERFFRSKFGPGSFYRYTHDEEYRGDLEDLLQRFIKRAEQEQSNQPTPPDSKLAPPG